MLPSLLPHACASLGGSSHPWTASTRPAWGGGIRTGWSAGSPRQSSSPGKSWEEGLPSHHVANPCWPGLGCWDPSVILGEQNGDENQLSAPQKEAHLTGAQIVCPWGVLGCQLDTEGWPGPCSLYLGGGCRPGRRALSLSLTEFTRPSRWAALHSPRRTGLSSEEGR